MNFEPIYSVSSANGTDEIGAFSLPGRPYRKAAVATALLWIATASVAQAQTLIYRCTDARGVTTLQNGRPCPTGSRQEKQVLKPVATAAYPEQVFAPPAPAPDTSMRAAPMHEYLPAQAAAGVGADAGTQTPPPASDPASAQRLPPPPLYQCHTPDNDSYLSDTSEPKPRCVPMTTVGIDGSAHLGAGQACSMAYDQCQRIPDNAACQAWRKRRDEAQSAWTFARAEQRDALKSEYDRITRVVAETNCSQ